MAGRTDSECGRARPARPHPGDRIRLREPSVAARYQNPTAGHPTAPRRTVPCSAHGPGPLPSDPMIRRGGTRQSRDVRGPRPGGPAAGARPRHRRYGTVPSL
eukprot:667986-Hanusia_phi.AAC.1